MKIFIPLFLFFLTSSEIQSQTNYYISPQGDNLNAGTSASAPWQNIQKAASLMNAGDTANIMSGTYFEVVSLLHSGTSSNHITYQNYNHDVVIFTQDFTLSKDYIRLKGIEFSGSSLRIDGNFCQIVENYIHDSGVCGMFIHGSYNVIRGNKIANNGSSWCNQISTGWGSGDIHHIVFEYNEISDELGRGEDFMQYLSHDFIARANYFHHLGNNGRHNDIYQSGGGDYNIWVIGNRFENLNSIQYYMMGTGDEDHIWRNNLFWGTIGWGFNGMPSGLRVINNTFSLIGASGGNNGNWGVGGVGKAFNNIFSPPGSDGHHGNPVDYNCVYPVPCCSDRGPNDLWNVNPLFVDAAHYNFRLQANSPCIDAGIFLTNTTGEGSGIHIPVADAKMFTDGFGISHGDSIQMEGQNQIAEIISINYATNVLTINRPLTWKNGQGVSLPYAGTAPDIGAYEYKNIVAVEPDLELHYFSIYPNPSKQTITIQRKDAKEFRSVEFFNVLGKMVKQEDILRTGYLDISSLHPGVYFIMVKNYPQIMKFIKE